MAGNRCFGVGPTSATCENQVFSNTPAIPLLCPQSSGPMYNFHLHVAAMLLSALPCSVSARPQLLHQTSLHEGQTLCHSLYFALLIPGLPASLILPPPDSAMGQLKKPKGEGEGMVRGGWELKTLAPSTSAAAITPTPPADKRPH